MFLTHGANRKMERSEYLNSSLSRYRLSEPTDGSSLPSNEGEGERVPLLCAVELEVEAEFNFGVTLEGADAVVPTRFFG